jgi:hypothetical protein
MNKNRIRGMMMEMRRHISLKSNSYPESHHVYAARMSVEVNVHYPGRSRLLPMSANTTERWCDEGREVSRGHSSPAVRLGEGLKMK